MITALLFVPKCKVPVYVKSQSEQTVLRRFFPIYDCKEEAKVMPPHWTAEILGAIHCIVYSAIYILTTTVEPILRTSCFVSQNYRVIYSDIYVH